MQGVRFYLEYADNKAKRKGEHKGTVVALLTDHQFILPGYHSRECIASVYDWPNSPVGSDSVARSYLRNNCKHISEDKAREIHPALFEYIGDSPFDEGEEAAQCTW